MAINFRDGVILGADSRTTTGAYIANRVTDKLTQVHDTIWCCRSGSAADTQAVADIVHYHLGMYGITNDEPPTTQTAAAIFQELCYDNKDQLTCVKAKSWDFLLMLTFDQGGHDYRRLRPPTWRPGIFNSIGGFFAQAVLRYRRFRVDVHLRILRCKLEGEYDRGGRC